MARVSGQLRRPRKIKLKPFGDVRFVGKKVEARPDINDQLAAAWWGMRDQVRRKVLTQAGSNPVRQ
jgi:hypothetical protein